MPIAGKTYLVTGANRGLGRGLVERYLARPSSTVVAAVRSLERLSSKSLVELPKGTNSTLIVVKIDSTSQTDALEAISKLKTEHSITHLDVVIANAGICKAYPSVDKATIAEMTEHFSVNSLGALLLFQAVVPLLRQAEETPKFVTMSSAVGSIGDMEATPVPHLAYGASKAALNFITRKMHFEHPEIIIFPVDPGWVQTELGDNAAVTFGFGEADITIKDCLDSLVKTIDKATKKKSSGNFMHYKIGEVPW
ncbi:hypothetical protein AJ80_00472 [Polytolypa hystricis UAMH7299]|uniref:Uncharacterized protein n=1 Tax=Polytolypa hystricis (strain UAMH7299) TaxID=1447883 RepID=A0A2B7Z4D3_POLH7|nr:hypothetical protein AJ80_00472 [Polytolypa hystricis UAMH7299]